MKSADIAWMLMATALVLLMTPALGFFYGGLVRSKNALNTMLAPAATLAIWTLLDMARTGKVTAVGAATAIVVGLAAVTPAAAG